MTLSSSGSCCDSNLFKQIEKVRSVQPTNWYTIIIEISRCDENISRDWTLQNVLVS